MSGSATLDPNVLVDSLVGVIDGLRGSLHPAFGVRPYRLYTVRRTWSGDMAGEGSFTDVEVEIAPQPRVLTWDGYDFDLTKVGVDEKGEVKVTEVSLTHTHADLVGPTLSDNEQWFIKLVEANGQGNPPRYFTHAKPPFVDREKDMGWVLWLRSVNVPGCRP